eukprot:1087379-Pleurochrysis_carterae.AAC.2
MEGEPYHLEDSWADITDGHSEESMWSEYYGAKDVVRQMMDESTPQLEQPILIPIMIAAFIPEYDWRWTAAHELRDLLKDCCVARKEDVVEFAKNYKPPPQIRERIHDWSKDVQTIFNLTGRMRTFPERD